VLGGRAQSSEDPWRAASGGKSSFLGLGEGFAEKVKVKEVEGARVVLWNSSLGEKLGLTAKDQQELEGLILKNFAVTTIGAENSNREMFATRYQDYPKELLAGLGNPQGDGRAVWSGEHRIRLENGQFLYLDFTIKGVGRTPLARAQLSEVGVDNRQYSDGLQSMTEAVRSFITSVALNKNGVQAVQDLAVIELPLTKTDSSTGAEIPAAITVRVGEQTRVGHLLYHMSQNPSDTRFRKLFDYVVKRGLGLDLKTIVQKSHVNRYLDMVDRNLGSQSATYLDLNFVHGSLSYGNQTTAGRPIDFGTSNIYSGFHAELKYLYGQNTIGQQDMGIKRYTYDFLSFVKKWGELSQSDIYSERLGRDSGLFDRTFSRDLTVLTLKRLGLHEREIRVIPRALIIKFMGAFHALLYMKSAKFRKTYDQWISPGVFDLHAILKSSMAILESHKLMHTSSWRRVFVTQRGWGTLTDTDLRSGDDLSSVFSKDLMNVFSREKRDTREESHDSEYYKAMKNYITAVTAIYDRLKEKGVSMVPILERARTFAKTPRTDRSFPDYSHILKQISEPGHSFAELSELAMKASNSIHDRHTDLSGRDLHPVRRCNDVLAGKN
jgi:uncharacterized protein YdiU (UPF0061 family)